MIKPTLLLLNAKVVSPPRVFNADIGVCGDKICFVGRAGEELKKSAQHVIDCSNRVVTPGFVDSHFHVLSTAVVEKLSADLSHARSFKEIVNALREWSTKFKGRWVIARGWDHEKLVEKRIFTKKLLDEAVPEKPAIAVRVCGHVAVVNSRAIEEVGLRCGDPGVECVDGVPTGVVYEDTVAKVWKHAVESLGVEHLVNAVFDILSSLPKLGITCVHAMDVSTMELSILCLLRLINALPVRVRVYLSLDAFRKLAAHVSGDDMLRVCGVKVFADGSFGARTAALREPYSDDATNRGRLLLSSKNLAKIVEEAEEYGMQVAVHAIGDLALEETLKALEESSMRHRIEHASLTPPDIVEKLSRLNLAVVVQPRFVVSDFWIIDRLGVERARYVYAYRTLIERGIPLASSSDSPVEPYDPLEGMRILVTRGKPTSPLAELTPEERLSPIEALSTYTVNGAYASRDEHVLGRVEPGFLADLVILDTEDPRNIPFSRVLATLVGGKVVYASKKLESL